MTAIPDEELAAMTEHEFGPALIGNKLRALRAERGWTQEDLAGRLDRSQTAVSYWEAGKRAVGWEDMLAISDVFDVPPSHFLPDDKAPPMPKPNITVSVGGDTRIWERQSRVIGMHMHAIADRFTAMADDLAQIRRDLGGSTSEPSPQPPAAKTD